MISSPSMKLMHSLNPRRRSYYQAIEVTGFKYEGSVVDSSIPSTFSKEEQAMPPGEEQPPRSSLAPQCLATAAATIAVFSAGSLVGWSSPALHMFKEANSTIPIHPTTDEESWITSLLTIGALLGAIPAGSVANLIGRKTSLLLLAIPLLVSWGIIFIVENIKLICLGRLIGGIAMGGLSTIAPLYISEIAEDRARGALGSGFQLMFSAGILFTYVVGAYASYYVMSILSGLIPILFLAAFFKAPESPSYLLGKGRRSQAEKSLRTLRGPNANVSKEVEELQREIHKQAAVKSSFFKAMGRRESRLALVITTGMMISQQFSGINIVIFYASSVFETAGSSINSQVCAILVGLALFLATVLTTLIVEKAGRKILLQISAGSMAVCLGVLAYFFFLKDRGDDVSSLRMVPIVAVIAYILVFGVGFGPICWMMAGEVLPEDIKGVGTSITVSLNWTLAFVITYCFQGVNAYLGNAGTYCFLAINCLVILAFSTFVIIETKGKSLQEIQDKLAGRKQQQAFDLVSTRDSGTP